MSPTLAGCSALSTTPNFIEQLELGTGGVTVHLNTGNPPDEVSLVQPNGTVRDGNTTSISGGQRTVEIPTIRQVEDSDLYTPISPGEYTIAAKGENDTQEQSLSLTHSFELTELTIETETIQGTPIPKRPVATIKNTGTLPLRINKIEVDDRVPGSYNFNSNIFPTRLGTDGDGSIDEYMISNKIGVLSNGGDSGDTSFKYRSGKFKPPTQILFSYDAERGETKSESAIKHQYCGQSKSFTLTIKTSNNTRRFTVVATYGSTIKEWNYKSTRYACTPVQITDYKPAE